MAIYKISKLEITSDILIDIKGLDFYRKYLLDRYIYLTYEFLTKNKKTVPNYFGVQQEKFQFYLPRNLNKLEMVIEEIESMASSKIEIENIKDDRVYISNYDGIVLKNSHKLRDYQEEPVKKILDILKNGNGKNKRLPNNHSLIFQAGTGFGKTYILPRVVAELKQPTLILVDRNILAEQMYKIFKDSIDKGTVKILDKDSIGSELADVNISTLQFLAKHIIYTEEVLSPNIGFLIVDECHLISVGTLSQVATSLPAKYRLGLSATPTRTDGLEEAIYDHMGYCEVVGYAPNLLPVQHIILKYPNIEINELPFYISNKVLTKQLTSHGFMKDIIQLGTELKNKLNRKILYYSTIQKQQYLIKEKLNGLGYSAEVLNAKTKKKDVNEIISKFNDGEIEFLISGKVIQKGVSIHNLDTIIDVSKYHNKESIEQTTGRLRRDGVKRTPMFITFFYGGGLGEPLSRAKIKHLQKMKKNKYKKDKIVMMSGVDEFLEKLNKRL